MSRTSRSAAVASTIALGFALLPATVSPTATAAPLPDAASPGGDFQPRVKQAVARGRGGAVASADLNASRIGLRVLKRGGTAADAAMATAAALGVTEPYSAGIGGGGYLLYYEADSGRVFTIDGRETAPASMRRNSFIDPDTGSPYPFFPDLVTSGVSVGVPGTPMLMDRAIRRFGNGTLAGALLPAARLADRGFRVDRTFHLQTSENAERFRAIRPTRRLFLVDGQAPAVGTVFRNPDLADTYRLLARRGVDALYKGALGADVLETVRRPPKTVATDLPVMPGTMRRWDLISYRALFRKPTRIGYRGLVVHGMPPSSSGGTTVGEALGILRGYDLGSLPRAQALHVYLEASALAFADRSKYLGDPAYVNVPVRELLSPGFLAERRCEIDAAEAAPKPVAAGSADGDYTSCQQPSAGAGVLAPDTTGPETTHLSAADRWGNVASFTLTIEQTGGSGITVPGRGFILNNELTDFSPVYDEADPNRIEGGKRPRSSMSPTLVLRDGKPVLAVGSPGGSTIITTVLQTLVNRYDLGMSLPRAVAAPRASQRNSPTTTAEQAFIDRWGPALETYGHDLALSGEAGTSAADIGAVAAVQIGPNGGFVAVAEPRRRGGGSALVVRPSS
jgi:gamma-glutamyltranspeptidase/glutathione hydrolase